MADTLSTARVITLAGEEFQRQERLSAILDEVVDPAMRDFNLDIVRPEDATTERITELVMTFPMMAARRVIVLRDFDAYRKDVQTGAGRVLAGTPDTALVIVEGEKVTLTPKPKIGLVAETFKPVYDDGLPGWIRGRFRAKGVTVDDAVIALLINNVGSVLRDLDGEIGKILIAVPGKDRLTESDVTAVVGTYRRETIYNLVNAVGLGDLAEAARILAVLSETEKNKETVHLAALFSHIVKLAEYNRLTAAGTPHQEAVGVVTPVPFFWRRNRLDEQARRCTPSAARRALIMLCRTESALKRSSGDKRLLLDIMLPLVALPAPKRA